MVGTHNFASFSVGGKAGSGDVKRKKKKAMLAMRKPQPMHRSDSEATRRTCQPDAFEDGDDKGAISDSEEEDDDNDDHNRRENCKERPEPNDQKCAEVSSQIGADTDVAQGENNTHSKYERNILSLQIIDFPAGEGHGCF